MNAKRVAVVTGAGQGIGRRTAEVLAARGYTLALNDIRPIGSTLSDAIEVLGDVSSESDVARIAQAVEQHYGYVDLLVNNAGISFIRPAEETGAAEWRRVLEVNLTGPFLMCRAFGKMMLARGSGAAKISPFLRRRNSFLHRTRHSKGG